MPTTAKGLPYPAATAPPNVPADLQALVADLDFTKLLLLLAANITSTSLLSAYPLGLSLLQLTAAQSAAGGWPLGGSSHVLTIKPTADRAAQYLYRNSPTALAVGAFYRQLNVDPGPHTAWIGGGGHYATYVGTVVLNTATNPTAAVVVNWPTGRFSVAPRVLLGTNSSVWIPSGIVNATSVSIVGRNMLATTGGTAPTISLHAIQATSASADTD